MFLPSFTADKEKTRGYRFKQDDKINIRVIAASQDNKQTQIKLNESILSWSKLSAIALACVSTVLF